MIEIVGTSHIAGEELAGIREKVEEEDPDVVAVELDHRRLQALISGDQGRTPSNPFNLVLKALQDFLGRKTGVAPGSDMLEAFHAARENGVDVALVDRDIGITLAGLREVPLREKAKFFGFLLVSPFLLRGGDIDLQEVPDRDIIDEMLLRLEVGFPEIYRVLVADRNREMAERLKALEREYGDVLAFVGAGHVKGLERLLGS
ncbi:MAG: TraB/GumN family protein [Candidatus Nanohaloarchaea archaeon]|nr:TraB/GumN family protein [Candidatus Nanohaloarchaea archaeon]